MPLPVSFTGLYWSMRGHVVCAEHAAQILDAAWNAEGWAAVPESSQGFRGKRYQCEHCAPDRTAVIHSPSNARGVVSLIADD